MSSEEKPKEIQPQKEDLVIGESFTYEFFQRNRYSISEQGNYQALCNNGFIKLYSKLCRVYWHTQNQFGHETMDWKFHISVKHSDLKKAWNLIAAIFFKMKCRAGMKTIYLKQSQYPQRGREITLYLIKYDKKFKHSGFAGDFGLDIDIQHSEQYWLQMCKAIERTLESYQIQNNGLAEGDYPLGKYISFRNQAFIRNAIGQSIYPPNSAGWNPLNYPVPINLQKFSRLWDEEQQAQVKNLSNKYRSLILLGIALVTSGFWYKFRNSLGK